MKGDFSRDTFDREQPRSSVRLQQGRVLLDADWNEQVEIQDDLRQTALRDVIGPCGVPAEDGEAFSVAPDGNSLAIEPGRIWVDGILCREDEIALDDDALEVLEALRDSGESAVVYLEVWQRHLTAVEEPEIREVALGGPDTATRTRTVCRVRVAGLDGREDGGDPSCADLGDWRPEGETTGTLSAQAAPPATSEDPCEVPSQAGYTGLENLLYRIEVHDGGDTENGQAPTFKWSENNGSFLTALEQVSGTQLTVRSLGNDKVSGFYQAGWAELSHDALDLAGQAGMLVEVDPGEATEDGRGLLTVTTGGFAYNLAGHEHPKVRRWDGCGEIQPDQPHALGQHHVEVTFSPGVYRSGDYWLVPARAFIGEFLGSVLWPQEGGQPAALPPHGVERHICKLAVVRWDGEEFDVLDDCRCVFPPLCGVGEGGCCCTVTVSASGRGDFTTVQAAVDAVPRSGGEVCILDGVYDEPVVVSGYDRLTIRGCGRRSVLRGPQNLEFADQAVLRIEDCRDVEVYDLRIEALGGLGVDLRAGEGSVERIALRDLEIEARDRSAIQGRDLESVEIRGCDVHYASPGVVAVDPNLEPAIFLGGRDLKVVENRIHVEDRPSVASETGPGVASGGVQIAGASERVVVSGNQILGGLGHGITLGSVQRVFDWVPVDPWFWNLDIETEFVPNDPPFPRAAEFSNVRVNVEGAGFTEAVTHYQAYEVTPWLTSVEEVEGGPWIGWNPTVTNEGRLVSDGDLVDVVIEGNRIEKMGESGISVAYFFELTDEAADLISVDRLRIEGNEIVGCARLPRTEATRREESGFGGVALAGGSGLVIRDNAIENNAGRFGDPTCGIFILEGRAISIDRNRITGNGELPQANRPALTGNRGGIVILDAGVESLYLDPLGQGETAGRRQNGVPALRVHDNVVVAPSGRALDVVALGPVSIHGNQFTALGASFQFEDSNNSTLGATDDVAFFRMRNAASINFMERETASVGSFQNVLGGAVVSVLDLGTSNELYGQLAGFSGLFRNEKPSSTFTTELDEPKEFIGGNILFHDNQVVFDAFDPVTTFAWSSVNLLSLADVSMVGNQLDCDLVNDAVMANGFALGFSVRVADNRFTEGAFNALLSALSFGLIFNCTTGNQSTHCLLVGGMKRGLVDRDNRNWPNVIFGQNEGCGWLAEIERALRWGPE